jgi:hypothetical protein
VHRFATSLWNEGTPFDIPMLNAMRITVFGRLPRRAVERRCFACRPRIRAFGTAAGCTSS